MAWGAAALFPTFGLGWRAIFAIYAAVSLLSVCLLAATPINEERPDKASGVMECLRLLGRPFILLCFLGIMCHVGIDVGTNTTAPKIIIERLGSILLRSVRPKGFFLVSICLILTGMTMLILCHTLTWLYTGIILIGLGNSNVFSIIFSQALIYTPNERNEVSGLMIMGLFGGTIFPLCMGFAADACGQLGAVAVMIAGAIYLLAYTTKIRRI